MEKTTGIKLPTSFPRTLEIEKTDSHIPSAPATTANLTQIQNPKGPSPVRLTFVPFRLILQLEKTGAGSDKRPVLFVYLDSVVGVRQRSWCFWYSRPIAPFAEVRMEALADRTGIGTDCELLRGVASLSASCGFRLWKRRLCNQRQS